MIKILRLSTGVDIISDIFIAEEVYQLTRPMEIEFLMPRGNQGAPTIVLSWWLPVPVLKENISYVCEKDILAVMDPTDDIVEYYTNSAIDQSGLKDPSGSNPSAMEGSGFGSLKEEDWNQILDQVPVSPNGLH